MKILYAIQGTGNGHVSRAKALIPKLQEKVALDILISGIESDVDLPFPVKYKMKGLSFIFGKRGGIDISATLQKMDPFRLLQDIRNLDLKPYDLVISDFEPISAWASRLKKVNCLNLSHQSAVSQPSAPRPSYRNPLGSFILKHYAPSNHKLGFHFKKYSPETYFPIIRPEIRNVHPKTLRHVTVYLPAYSDEHLIKILSPISTVDWHIFSKHSTKKYAVGKIRVHPVDNRLFVQSMVDSSAVFCGAGFETPAEALYLKKKLLVIPMKGQYEQQCNAAALAEMGVPVLTELTPRSTKEIETWLNREQIIDIEYPDELAIIIEHILKLTGNEKKA